MYSLKKRVEQLKAGFIGKPDESNFTNYGIRISDKYVSYSAPSNNRYTQYKTDISTLVEEFLTSKESTGYHEDYVLLSCNAYHFSKVIKNILTPYNSLGHLYFTIRLKQFNDIDCMNLSYLSNAIYSRHYEYFNEFDDKNPFKGRHKKEMIEAEEYVQIRWSPYDGRELTEQEKQERDDFIDRSYHTTNPPLKINRQTLGGNEFLTYCEGKLKYSNQVNSYYCLPIDEDFYLSFEFIYEVEKIRWNKKFKKWVYDRKILEEKIIKTIELSNIVNSDLEQINDNR